MSPHVIVMVPRTKFNGSFGVIHLSIITRKLNIEKFRVAASITEYHIISKLIFQRIIIQKFIIRPFIKKNQHF